MTSARPLLLRAAAFGVLALSSAMIAQQTGATLTGRVICADTNAPARFAKVLLKSASPGPQGNDFFSALSQAGNEAPKKNTSLSPEQAADQKAQLAAATRVMAGLSDLLYSATIGADGTYTFNNVKPGTYYVHATVPGYVDPFSAIPADDFSSADPEVRKRVAASVTTVTIDSSGSARADLRIERGASITGRVVYDDGSPAVGWTVRPVYPAPPGADPYAALGFDRSDLDLAHLKEAAATDDTGRFHISGLPAGDYTLQARLATAVLGTNAASPMAMPGLAASGGAAEAIANMSALRLTVYSGNALRLADAKPVHVTAGEERTGVDLTMPLHVLHSVSGHVTAQADGRAVNAGSVELTALDAAGKPDASLHLTAIVHQDGSFRFDYVPGPFSFILKVVRARDMEPAAPKHPRASGAGEDAISPALAALSGPSMKVAHSYGSASTTLQTSSSDLDNITLTVPDATPAPDPGLHPSAPAE